MKHSLVVLSGLMLCGWAILGSGCATLNDGTTQDLSFQSSPEGVTVTLSKRVQGDGPDETVWKDVSYVLGKTPFAAQLDRAEGQTVIFSRDGYKSVTMRLTTITNPNYWGNLAFGGVFGSTTDSASGAMYEYSPSQYFVTLTPLAASSVESPALQGERERAKGFIVRRHASILADLSKNGGDDLSALMGLLRVQTSQEADARRKIRALSEVYTDLPVFADRLIELYLK